MASGFLVPCIASRVCLRPSDGLITANHMKPGMTKKFQVRLKVKHMVAVEGMEGAIVDVEWKEPPEDDIDRMEGLMVRPDGVIVWKQEFERVCTLSANTEGDNQFHPCKIKIKVFKVTPLPRKERDSAIAKATFFREASLNLAEFISVPNGEIELNLPLELENVSVPPHSIEVKLLLHELQTLQEISEKDKPSGIKSGSPSRSDEGSEEKFSVRNNDSDGNSSFVEKTAPSVPGQSQKGRKFISQSSKTKGGGSLLKKTCKEEDQHDIKCDQRQQSSSGKLVSTGICSDRTGGSDDNTEIGSWTTEVIDSPDDQMQITAQVFYASMDQMSESVGGDAACSVLAVFIADWFHKNKGKIPTKSQFDSLIREGSRRWRELCEKQEYIKLFPNKHFDLNIIIKENLRPLYVDYVSIGFFHPEAASDKSWLEVFSGLLSFDTIWDGEISRTWSVSNSDGSPRLYILSWNDHFLVLKVEENAYYIIDTLGENLYDGCKQGYIMKFDKSTSIYKNQEAQQNSNEEFVCRGKESCKEYIKSFMSAITINEVQADIESGQLNPKSEPRDLYKRIQIDFHRTKSSEVPDAAL